MLATEAAATARWRLDSVPKRAAAVALLAEGTARFDRPAIASAIAMAAELSPIYGSVHSPATLAAADAAIEAIEVEEKRLASLRAALCRCVAGALAGLLYLPLVCVDSAASSVACIRVVRFTPSAAVAPTPTSLLKPLADCCMCSHRLQVP
jgi:hypothetical protein